MKIALVTHSFDSQLSGAAGVAYDLATRLKELGHDITVFTGGLVGAHLAIVGMRVFQVALKECHWIFRSYVSLRNIRIEIAFQQFLNEARPEVVHFHNLYYQFPWSLVKIAKQYGCRVLFTAHDSAPVSQQKLYHFINRDYDLTNINQVNYYLSPLEQLRENGKAWNPLRNFFIRYYLSYTDKVIVVSNELKKALEQNGVGNVGVVYNGIDVARWFADPEELEPLIKKHHLVGKKVILLAGRLSYHKGVNAALRALRVVVDTIPEAVLLVVGSDYEYTNSLIHELNVRDNVIFAGVVSRADMRFYYHVSDVVIVPSLCLETFGMVALEAMACAKPVIGTVFGGVREVVQNDMTGYIVNPLKTKDFADKVISLLTNLERARIFGETGRERARKAFSLERQIGGYFRYYR